MPPSLLLSEGEPYAVRTTVYRSQLHVYTPLVTRFRLNITFGQMLGPILGVSAAGETLPISRFSLPAHQIRKRRCPLLRLGSRSVRVGVTRALSHLRPATRCCTAIGGASLKQVH